MATLAVFAIWIGGALAIARWIDFQAGLWWFIIGIGPVAAFFN